LTQHHRTAHFYHDYSSSAPSPELLLLSLLLPSSPPLLHWV
jgi:hypothetical protein